MYIAKKNNLLGAWAPVTDSGSTATGIQAGTALHRSKTAELSKMINSFNSYYGQIYTGANRTNLFYIEQIYRQIMAFDRDWPGVVTDNQKSHLAAKVNAFQRAVRAVEAGRPILAPTTGPTPTPTAPTPGPAPVTVITEPIAQARDWFYGSTSVAGQTIPNQYLIYGGGAIALILLLKARDKKPRRRR